MLERILKDDRGVTAVEYCLVASLISIAFLVAAQSLGLNLAEVFTTIADALAGR